MSLVRDADITKRPPSREKGRVPRHAPQPRARRGLATRGEKNARMAYLNTAAASGAETYGVKTQSLDVNAFACGDFRQQKIRWARGGTTRAGRLEPS